MIKGNLRVVCKTFNSNYCAIFFEVRTKIHFSASLASKMMNSLLRRAIPSLALFPRQTVRLLSAEAGKPDFTKLVTKNKVVVFMKGVPDAPKCGFSNAVVQIMRMHGVNFDSYNVLEDEDIRQGIKEFSNWPTIPQVFINGEFVGGCDILIQMHKSGDLIEELKKVGIESELLKEELEKPSK